MKKMKPPVYDPKTGLPYTVDDLGMRLCRTLVRYKGEPVYIAETAGNRLVLMNLLDRKAKEIRLPDKHLNVRPVPLGYVNSQGRMHYCSRVPHRKYKQGLCSEALHVSSGMIDRRALLQSVEMGHCVMNMYPSFKESLDKVQREGGSCAFSRRFGLSKDKSGVVFVEYRGDRVGWYSGQVELGEKHFYLKEELEVIYEGA